MLISSITLNNIRSYTKQTIEFEQGINVLYGNIGSGKSTILLAIEVALFGLKKGEGSFILRKGTKDGSISITLKNANSNAQITIMRTFKRTKTGVSQESGQITIDNEKLDLSTQEMNSHIFNYFNFPISFMNKDKTLMYRFTHYTPQEQLKEILTTQSDKRLEILRKVFNIDKYKQLQQASTITSRQLSKDILVHQTKIGELPTDLDKLVSKTKEEIQINQTQIRELKEKELAWNSKLKTVMNNKRILEDRKATIQQKIERSKEIKAQIEKSNALIHDSQKEISSNTKQKEELSKQREELIEKDKKFKEELESLKHKNIDVDDVYNQIQKIQESILEEKSKTHRFDEFLSIFTQIRDLKHDIVENTCRIKDIEVNTKKKEKIVKKLQKKQNELEQRKEELQKIEKIIIEKETQVKTLETQIETLKNAINKSSEFNEQNKSYKEEEILCPTCNQQIDANHIKLLEQSNTKRKKEFEQLPEIVKRDELKNQIKTLEQEVELQKAQEKSFDREEFELETLTKQNREIEQKVVELIKKRNEIFSTEEQELYINSLKDDTFKSSISISIQELEEKKNKLQKQIEESKKQFELQKKLEENIQQTQSSIQQTQYSIDLKKLKLEELEKQIVEYNTSIKENTQELEKLQKEVEYNDKIVQKIKDQEQKETAIENKKNELVQKISQLQTKTQYLEKELEELENKIKKKNHLEEILQKTQTQKEFLQQDVVEVCKILEETLFVEIHTDLSKILLSYFKELIEEQDIDIMIREDFSVIVEQNGYEVEVEQLSGGEKSALALSYRLALKEVIEKHFRDDTALDYIILDEPTDGFSQNQIQKFASILQNSDFKQIFLVSHDSNLLSSGEYVYTIEKENHTSTIELSNEY